MAEKLDAQNIISLKFGLRAASKWQLRISSQAHICNICLFLGLLEIGEGCFEQNSPVHLMATHDS